MGLNEYGPGTVFSGVVGRTVEASSPAWPRPLRAALLPSTDLGALRMTHNDQAALAGLPITRALIGIRKPSRRRHLGVGLGVGAVLAPQGMAHGQLADLR